MGRKLKRFLLRYDPPGIGLEVQQGGESEIVHKDLLPTSQVSTAADILAEVDRIIAEDEMLTKKRHRPALIQLLGRLYQVDVSNLDGEEDGAGDDSPGQSPKESKSSEKAPALQEGSVVVLTGLQGDLQLHNGEIGTLSKCRHEKKKYEVRLVAGAEVKVKGPEHIVLCAPKGTPLSVGAGVVIRGLRNHMELNGCLGRVVESHEETHRFEVRAIESGQLFRVKQENLIPIDIASLPASLSPKAAAAGSVNPEAWVSSHAGGSGGEDEGAFPVGSLVELVGLKTAMAYNGQTAEVLSVDRSRHRYEIRLGDGSVKTIRAENVVLAKQAAKASPRTGKTRRTADRAK